MPSRSRSAGWEGIDDGKVADRASPMLLRSAVSSASVRRRRGRERGLRQVDGMFGGLRAKDTASAAARRSIRCPRLSTRCWSRSPCSKVGGPHDITVADSSGQATGPAGQQAARVHE